MTEDARETEIAERLTDAQRGYVGQRNRAERAEAALGKALSRVFDLEQEVEARQYGIDDAEAERDALKEALRTYAEMMLRTHEGTVTHEMWARFNSAKATLLAPEVSP
jgi:multidrug resistance efflux pump